MKYRIDYSDGRYTLHEVKEGQHGPIIELSKEDCNRLEAFWNEEAYWQNRFREVDNQYQEENP